MDFHGGSFLNSVVGLVFRLHIVCFPLLIMLSPSHVLSRVLAIHTCRQRSARRCVDVWLE